MQKWLLLEPIRLEVDGGTYFTPDKAVQDKFAADQIDVTIEESIRRSAITHQNKVLIPIVRLDTNSVHLLGSPYLIRVIRYDTIPCRILLDAARRAVSILVLLPCAVKLNQEDVTIGRR